jgi:site-specific DNA recombinase
LGLSADTFRIGPMLRKVLTKASHLTELYQNADIQEKRLIISSMFPENLTFAGVRHRTTRINEAIRFFSALKADFGSKNKGKLVFKTDLPSNVAGSRIELPTSGL